MKRWSIAFGVVVVAIVIAATAFLSMESTAFAGGATKIAQGGGAVHVNEPDPPPGPPDRFPTAHNHTFGFNLTQSTDGSYWLNISYVDSHDNVPGGPDGQFMLQGHGVSAWDVTHVRGSFVYFKARVTRRGPGPGGTGPTYICVWAEDGNPDNFGLSTPGGYSSGPSSGPCVPGIQGPQAPLGGPGLDGGKVTVR